MRQRYENTRSSIAIARLYDYILHGPVGELSLGFLVVIAADHDEDTISREAAFDASQRVLQHGLPPDHRAELLNATPATELLEKGAHACAFTASQDNSPPGVSRSRVQTGFLFRRTHQDYLRSCDEIEFRPHPALEFKPGPFADPRFP